MITAQFERYIRPAQKFPQVWRIVLGTFLIFVGYLLGIAAMFLLVFIIVGGPETLLLARSIADTVGRTETILLLFSFAGALIAPMLVVRMIHKRAANTLFGPKTRLLHDFVSAAGLFFSVNVLALLGWSLWFDTTPNLPLSQWLRFLPLIISGLLIQTLAEETIFRGYLPQQLAARFRSPLVWMLLPSLAFGALHIDPASMGPNTWLVAGSTVVFALIATDLTRITGSLGAAWGMHFANNFIAIALISTKGTITGASLFLTPYDSNDPLVFPILLSVDLGILLLCWMILRRILQR